MEAKLLSSSPGVLPVQFERNTESIKRKLLEKGVHPTPKILHAIRKKEILKQNRRIKKSQAQDPFPLTESQKQALHEESQFQIVRREYFEFNKILDERDGVRGARSLAGKPWESVDKAKFLEASIGSKERFRGRKLERESLNELKEVFRRNWDWISEDNIEIEDNPDVWDPTKRRQKTRETIRFLVEKLSRRNVTVRDWKLTKVMKLSGLRLDEGQLLKIVEGLQRKRKWEQALAVVDWAYNLKGKRKSRIVYKRILSFLSKERRPKEALRIYQTMLEDPDTYPDMSAYNTIAVALGQAGLVTELLKIMKLMKLEPDLVVYNSVLNGCVSFGLWKGVLWVFHKLRKNRIKPNGATYGLAMEVMLRSRSYEILHELFERMIQNGEQPNAITYRVLIKSFGEEGKVNEAVEAVREMEERGVHGVASVYYELACCLCYNGRWKDALMEVEKMKRVSCSKPLAVSFTGMIQSAMEGGHLEDCKSIFLSMEDHCGANIGVINTMIRVFSKTDSFAEAKNLFEECVCGSMRGDEYTYNMILEASARAHQWEYFDSVYKQMVLNGYQLDQTKHASLLVEASIHGKGHLLEHAFDATLEAGEVPALPFFFEILIGAIGRDDWLRAVNIMNSLACAPFRVSVKQWMDLLQRNKTRLVGEDLQKLRAAISRCDFSSEITIVNMETALRSFSSLICSESESNREEKLTCLPATGGDGDGDRSHGSNGSVDFEFHAVDNGSKRADRRKEAYNLSSDDEEYEMFSSDDEKFEAETPSAEEILRVWRGRRSFEKRYRQIASPRDSS